MECPHCHTENRTGARFCGRCGEALEVQPEPAQASSPYLCPACGNPLKPGARFCGRCGSLVASEVPVDAVRPPSPPGNQVIFAPVEDPGASRSEAEYSRVREPVSVAPVVFPSPTVREASRPQSSPVQTPQDAASTGARAAGPPASRPPNRLAWPLMILMAALSGVFSLCLVVALAAGPALGKSVPALPLVDTSRPDLTINVEEAFISEMVGGALPGNIGGDFVLDVQQGNLIVTTIDFDLLFISLQVVVKAAIAVEDGAIVVRVESIDTGGQDLLDLLGKDQLVLGEDVTRAIQDVLEDELGEGAELLSISTDDARVILTARWE